MSETQEKAAGPCSLRGLGVLLRYLPEAGRSRELLLGNSPLIEVFDIPAKLRNPTRRLAIGCCGAPRSLVDP
jgi:hypothetical protein